MIGSFSFGTALAILFLVCSVSLGVSDVPEPAREALPERVTFKDVIALLRERSPRIRALRSEIGVAASGVISASLIPNPEIGYSSARTVGGQDTIGETIHGINLGLPLLLAGQRSTRKRAAELQAAAVRSLVEASEAQLTHQARSIAVALLAGQERVRILEETISDMEQIFRLIQGRAEAGTKSPYDVERIRLELAARRSDLSEAQTLRKRFSDELASLLALPGWNPFVVGDLRPRSEAINLDELWARAERSLPRIRAVRDVESASTSAVTAAQREAWPIPIVSVGGFTTADPHGTVVSFGVSLPLPLFDRNQGGIARARAEERVANLVRQAAEAEALAALGMAAQGLVMRREALQTFERDAVARLGEIRRMAETAYWNAQGGVVEFLDAIRTVAEIKEKHVDLLERILQVESDLDAATGNLQ